MQPLKNTDFPIKRALIAACFLIGTLLTVVWVFSDSIKNAIDKKFPGSLQTQYTDAGPLFYRSVGHAPENFQRPNLSKNRRSKAKSFTLEISSKRTKVEANRALKKLSKSGIQAYYTPLNNQGRVIYRVRTGVFRTKKQALRMSKKLRLSKNLRTKAVRLN